MVLASEKTFNETKKALCVWDRSEIFFLFHLKKPMYFIFSNKILWFKVSKAFWRSIKIIRVCSPFLPPLKNMSRNKDRFIRKKWFAVSLIDKYALVHFLKIIMGLNVNCFFITFDTKDNRETSLFIFPILHFERKGSSFSNTLIMLIREVAITRGPSLRNLEEVRSIVESLATSRVFNFFSTEGISTLHKKKSSHIHFESFHNTLWSF